MAGLKDYQISVYVANLGKYVEGVLQGAWITLPMPAERLQDTLKTEVGLGGRYEEYAIHDYEGGEGLLATVANPGEYESLTDLNLMCRAFDAAGRHYDGGKESVDRFWNDLKTDRGLSVEPRYVELAFGCPPIEWDIDARVRDFAERMGDEYTSLYEQDTTSIKGGDFERFGAFADNHLDFIRALTKARGMDPISSDREIGAFLNTFDKLAAMPEPTPAKQEKDELSAGACDPADPLNLEQSSSYGMTR